MIMRNFFDFIKAEKLFSILFFLVFMLSLRTLFLSLQGDEITYNKIATNILEGKYYQTSHPSSVIPIVPFLMAFFSTSKIPLLGFILHKLFHLFLTIVALRFCYLTLSTVISEQKVLYSILLLTVVSSGFLSTLPSLYPEAIILVTFWGFFYYFNLPKSVDNFKKLFFLLILLIFTRYVYAVLGVFVLLYYYSIFTNSRNSIWKIIFISAILSTPLLFWFKYVYNIESQNLSEISYFNRFKSDDNPIWYNIKCGLGLEQHYETKRINGIPAFISLFVPMTGIRNYIVSSFLLAAVFYGLYLRNKNKTILNLLIGFSLVFIGFIFAGTGFSRYWLVLLPIIYLSYYLIYARYFKNTTYFVLLAQSISFILILNEIRVTFLIFNKLY